MAVDREQVLAALRSVQEPELFKDIVTLGLVKSVDVVDGSLVSIAIELTTANGQAAEAIDKQVRTAMTKIGVDPAKVRLAISPRGAANTNPSAGPGQSPKPTSALPQVKNIIAVGAGKGGVGKSTIAVNLAVGLHRAGATVGLMDGDIYGPSMPTMLGIRGVPPRVRGNKILPHHVHGIHAITIGSLVEMDKPLIWRGPMAHGAFKQLLLDNTDWPAVDYMIVDLPPGTGDVPLTLCQLLPLTGAVVVATPQQVALDDAVRAIKMFQQLGAPILGVIENMSYLPLPEGGTLDLFGRGGAKEASTEWGVPFIGELPMFTELRVNSDAGKPHANFEANAALRDALETLVKNLVARVDERNAAGAPVELTMS